MIVVSQMIFFTNYIVWLPSRKNSYNLSNKKDLASFDKANTL